ncbi:contractile injection system tape measure protein, partial [Burkholderia ubonensis]|uniref:contractile injection system tape measure protein n=1 Tax=Burkholderia ubonensis TaxID=101571 RepID=UPI0034E9457F
MRNHSVDRLRISLSVSPENVAYFTDRSSRLFHRELPGLLERVASRVIPAGLSIRLDTPLVLDLGELPGTAFERTFCRRLERALEQAFKQYVANTNRQGRGKRVPRAECQALLKQALHAADEAPDSWLLRQLENGPAIWWPVLADYALLPEGAALNRRLRQETVRHLCGQLAPGIPVQGELTRDSLWLSALLYFLRHPELPMPQAPPVPRPGAPPMLDTARYAGAGRPHDVRLISALFEYQPISASHLVSLRPWLRHLWLSPVVFDRVWPTLESRQVIWWHTQLTGERPERVEPYSLTAGGRPYLQPTGPGLQLQVPRSGESPAASAVSCGHPDQEQPYPQLTDPGIQWSAPQPGEYPAAPVVSRSHPEEERHYLQLTDPGIQWPAPQTGEYPAAPAVSRSHPEEERPYLQPTGPGVQWSALQPGEYPAAPAVSRGHTKEERPYLQPTGPGVQWSAPQPGEYPATSAISRRHTEGGRPVEQKHAVNRAPLPGRKGLENTSVWRPVSHAGVVLLWPVLPGLFRQLGLLEGKRFLSRPAQHQAAACLDWLAREELPPQEPPTISRWLCGLTPGNAVGEALRPNDAVQEMLGHWL